MKKIGFSKLTVMLVVWVGILSARTAYADGVPRYAPMYPQTQRRLDIQAGVMGGLEVLLSDEEVLGVIQSPGNGTYTLRVSPVQAGDAYVRDMHVYNAANAATEMATSEASEEVTMALAGGNTYYVRIHLGRHEGAKGRAIVTMMLSDKNLASAEKAAAKADKAKARAIRAKKIAKAAKTKAVKAMKKAKAATDKKRTTLQKAAKAAKAKAAKAAQKAKEERRKYQKALAAKKAAEAKVNALAKA